MKASQRRASGTEPFVRTLLIDNYDSYTYNLYQILSVVNGCEALVVPNDVSWEALCALEFDNIVLSPGPGHPGQAQDFGVCARVLAQMRVPLLGVCLGHQGIVLEYGGQIARENEIFHGQRSRIFHAGHPLFAGIPQGFLAVRYHSLIAVEPMPAQLEAIAWTQERSIMAVAARDRPFYGVQFHPESWMTEQGVKILENFRDATLSPAGLPGYVPHVPQQTKESVASQPASYKAFAPTFADGALEVPRLAVRVLVERISGGVDAQALCSLLRGQTPLAWLDSVRRGVDTGRFSYIASTGGSLAETVRYDQASHTCTVSGRGATRTLPNTGIFAYLAERSRCYDLALPQEFPLGFPFGFCGGYVGWIGYECKMECGFAPVHTAPTDDAALFFADRLIVLDHDCDEISLVALVPTHDTQEANGWLSAMRTLIAGLQGKRSPGAGERAPGKAATAAPLQPQELYLRNIARCQEVLFKGDSYQICLSNRFAVESDVDAFTAYARLRRANPAPYAAYLDFGRTQVACASPERFVRVTRSGIVEAKPIKGTTARNGNPLLDAQLALELSRDVKETAENLMIVDLLRNDLGRVCTVGSVYVPSLMAIESLETLHQMVSTIRGEVRGGANAVDCLRACFPGGSMTGAPKLRATSVINELESSARGVYSGVLGYLSVDGVSEFNIVIRTLIYHDGAISLGAGGGITVLSNGEREWEEVLLKARSVLTALDAEIVGS